jgi:colicin import membrane protein
MNRLPLLLAVACLAGAWAEVSAQGAVDRAAQRQRMARERAEAQAAYRRDEAACRQRFAVTPCIDEARARRRGVLERLDHEQAVLDEWDRKRRAAERMERIEEKLRQAESRPRPGMVVKPRHPAASAPASEPATPRRSADTHDPKAAEAAHHRRNESAERHRAALERRHAERAARRPPAASLPATPASR